MATIKKYKKKDGSTAYQFNAYLGIDPLTGKSKRTTRRGFKTQKDAKLALSRLEYEVSKHGFKQETNQTYEDVYNSWRLSYVNTVKESSYAYTISLFDKYILPKLSKSKIKKLGVFHCQKVIDEWFTESPNRYKRIKNYASKVFDYAISLNLIDDNPMKKIIVPTKTNEISANKTINNYYDKEQLIEFLKLCSKSNSKVYLFFRLLAYTGMRKGELLSLTWEDVNISSKEITVNKTLARGLNGKLLIQTPKTINSVRNIIIDDKTLKLLKRWKLEQKQLFLLRGINILNSKQLVFSNEANQLVQPSAPSEWMTSVLKGSSLPKIKIHGFRHTHCSLLFESGASIKEVQERLGHSDIRTTMDIYTHVTESAKNTVADNFSKYINF